MMFTTSPNATMHCQTYPLHAIRAGAYAAFRCCWQCGQGGLRELVCPQLFGNTTLILFCVGKQACRPTWPYGFRCQTFCEDACVPGASSLEEGSSKGASGTGLGHGHVRPCILGNDQTAYVLLVSVLTGRGLELGHGSLRFGDPPDFCICTHLFPRGRLRLALFLAWSLHMWIEMNSSSLRIFRHSSCCWKASKNSLAFCLRPQIRSHATSVLHSKGWLQDWQQWSWRPVASMFTQICCQHQHAQHCIKMGTGQAGLLLTCIFPCESPGAAWPGPLPKHLCWVPP